MKYLRKNAVTIFLSLLTAVTLLCGVILFFNPQKTYAIADTSDTTAVVRVGELTLSDYETRTDGKVFNADNLSTLYQYLTGISNASLTTVKNKVAGTQAYGNSTIAKMLTSQDIRTNVGTATGTARDIVVSFGGYEWTVTSLTTDINGDPIVTLWLANSTETSVWQNYEVTAETDYGDYPPNMYATSYIRAVTLNAGGSYETSNTTLTSSAQSSNSQWAKFTMSSVSGSLTSFIDTPSQIKYQEVESWPLQVIEHSDYTGTTYYYLKNDSYGTPDNQYGSWNASESNYATYEEAGEYYDNWKNDYLWIPSHTETGRGQSTVNGTTYYSVKGIWDTTENQRANSGTSWLRSGIHNACNINYLTPVGSYSSAIASASICVRPALHLNLAAAAKNVGSDVSVTVDELTLSGYAARNDGAVFNSANLSTLYQYLTGVEGATYANVASLVQGQTQAYGNSEIAKMLTSADINKNVGTLTGSARDIIVSFGGYDWTVTSLTTDENGDPIVTLWLAESDETSVWQNYTVYTSTDYGDYPPNMYGTSYMRVVTLNAGGSYATSNAAVTDYAQSSSSKWAKFTMSNATGSLTQFIDTPAQIKYQEIESGPLSSGYVYFGKNEAYGTPDNSIGSWSSSESTSNYATYTKAGQYYDNWKDDYLWLPSLPEVGGYNSTVGIWGTSENQRSNSSISWLRSGLTNVCIFCQYLTAVGSVDHAVPSTAYAVRPALHLNLAEAEANTQVNAQVTVNGSTTDYYSVESAFTAANAATTTADSRATIKLLIDCTTTATLTVESGSFVTLDLNGRALKTTGDNPIITNTYGDLSLTDSNPTTEHKFTVTESGLWVLDETNGTQIVNGGVITGGSGTYGDGGGTYVYGGGVYVYRGTFTMDGGTITGNTATDYGGGVYVYNGTFTMNGGTISGNTSSNNGGGVLVAGTFTMNDGTISDNTASSGGGVYVYNGTFTMTGGTISDNVTTLNSGGGVFLYMNSSFTMSGGTISGNNSACHGGGVYLFNSENRFEMSGGEISDNTAPNNGGGVFFNTNATFTMEDGAISGNTATYGGGVLGNGTFNIDGGTISGNTATYGGGVYVSEDGMITMNAGTISGNTASVGGGVYVGGGTFTMSNGEITNNTASEGGGGVSVSSGGLFTMTDGTIARNTEMTYYGGGVLISNTSTFEISGGTITDNTASKNGGGVYMYIGGTFSVSGTPAIYGNTASENTSNVHLLSDSQITLSAALTDGAKIGVTLGNISGVFTSGYSTYNTAKPSAYFFADNGKCIALSDDEATITEHSYGAPVWTWSDDGTSASATFTCTVCGDEHVETATVTDEVTTAATCEEKGTTTYTATVTFNGTYSSNKEVADIPALGHNYQAVVTAPTCTEQGYTTYTCTHDSTHSYIDDYTDATGHQWNNGVITTEATCETAGVKTYTCTECSETYTEEIPALGHDYQAVVTAPTCTEQGYTTYTCTHDGSHTYTSDIVPATGHQWNDGEVTTQPTTESTGIKTYTCTACGATYTEEIAKLVSDEGGKGDVVDLPPLTDPDSEYELEITVKATDKQYNMDGVNKGYLIELWIVNGDSKTPYDKSKTVTLSLVVPEGMEEFTLYRVGTDFEEVDESEYTVEGGILTIRTTLSAEFVFHTDKTDEGSKSQSGMAWYWWLIIALIVVAIIVIVVIIILKKRKKKGDPEKTPETVVQVEKYDDAELKQRLNAQQKQIDELLNRDDDGFNDIVDDK